MILRVLLYGLLIYFAYRLIFDFIIPVYKTTKKLKKGFQEMSARMNHSDGQERMQESGKEQQPFQPPPSASGPKAPKSGDYIDFEELK
ncbi:MAG TPA: hypothetical protein VLJ68_05520 [Chitinophagaceae bacterium]|nr:hypothetical protein [Chitinophagaceae bacterium]